MNAFDFATAPAAGATIVTPNNRLARHLVARFDERQRAAGKRTWTAARALPWNAWLDTLWLDALAASTLSATPQAIGDGQVAHLWDRIVAQASPALLDVLGAAEHAVEAWRLYHAWRRPDDRLESWAHAGIGDDAAVFADWATRYRSILTTRGLIDHALLPDWLAGVATHVSVWRDLRIVLVGFAEFTPQQRRLCDALRAVGATIGEADPPHAAAPVLRRVECATPAAELADALAWARAAACSSPLAAIGIVVEDLAARRAEVIAAADDILCPALAMRIAPDKARPYDISLGVPLADVPLVAAALDLITLAGESLPVDDALRLLRSPYLPGAHASWQRRAMAERSWREAGLRTVRLGDVLALLAQIDAPLGNRWTAVSTGGAGARTPAQWAGDWRTWLDRMGWPGDRALDSGEWQSRDAWLQLLAAFGALGVVTPDLARADALVAVRALAGRATFQPEAPPARIRIMGVLEAAGLDFDAMWLAGFTAERWPASPQPNPLLPLAWQRERDVPRSKADNELRHARALTAGFAGAARDVIVSHGRIADGFERTGSALFLSWPAIDRGTLPQPNPHAHVIAAAAPELEPDTRDKARELVAGTIVRGGVGIVESQSTCPFQAFARYRLRADALPGAGEGLTSMERGSLLHAALAAFWTTVRDHAHLVALDAATLTQAIDDAVQAALGKVNRKRWSSMPRVVAAGEARRLGDTLRAWIGAFERERPPFSVAATEVRTSLTLGGITFMFQIDRVDALADGGAAIIDYKSGRVPQAGRWFAVRPSGTQIGLYALAYRAAPNALPLRAVAYAQIKAGQLDVAGLAADAAAWPRLPSVDVARNVPVTTWPEVEAWWVERLGRLARDFRSGEAAVVPRDAAACRYCDLQPLCRVRALDDDAPVAAIASDD